MISPPYPHELHKVVSIRWYCNAIENVALEAYMGAVGKMPAIEEILDAALSSLKLLALEPAPAGEKSLTGDSCPWPCGPGVCRPSCGRPSNM